ncbi:MAG: hypothetical protein ACLQRH_22390 [Acidimicrobiales bacterium]
MATSRAGKPPDPLGKRALYGSPSSVDGGGESTAARPSTAGQPAGKRTLYSGANSEKDGGRGAFTVRCQRCQRVSRVGLLELLILQFPLGVWIPRGRFDRRMTCPSCRRRAWCSVSLRRD